MNQILITILSTALVFGALLLVGIILLQRGRGGGLLGAFGGAGGHSAFGTKAGDVFTRLTLAIAIVWVTLAVATGYAMSQESGKTRFPVEVEQLGAANPRLETLRPIIEGAVAATPEAEQQT